ncbi:MAG: hypothetical protein ACI9UQ_001168 [Candidatus Krumholzibacteriia bacterium]|jgi:hypothetical protein
MPGRLHYRPSTEAAQEAMVRMSISLFIAHSLRSANKIVASTTLEFVTFDLLFIAGEIQQGVYFIDCIDRGFVIQDDSHWFKYLWLNGPLNQDTVTSTGRCRTASGNQWDHLAPVRKF